MSSDPFDARLLNRQQIRALIPVSDVTLWRWEKQGLFPARIKLGASRVFWLERQVLDWLEARLSEASLRSASPPRPGSAEDA